MVGYRAFDDRALGVMNPAQQCVIQLGSIDHDDVLPIRKGLAVNRVTCSNQAASLERGGDDGKSHDSVTQTGTNEQVSDDDRT
jgi:hypothetical protein